MTPSPELLAELERAEKANVVRDISGETVGGMRVAAWMKPVPTGFDPPSSTTMPQFATHWSTLSEGAERLFHEADVLSLLQALASVTAERDEAWAEIESLKAELYADADLAREVAAQRADRSTLLPPDIKRLGDLLMRAEVAGGYPEDEENDAYIGRLFIADRYRFATMLEAARSALNPNTGEVEK